MIFEELKKLAEREHLLADEGYGPQKIHALIVIDRDGHFYGLQSQVEMAARGKGKPRREARILSMPSPEGRRTSGPMANFLYDKAEYVFGRGEADAERLAACKRLFRGLVRDALDATNDEGLRAVSCFLDRLDRGEIDVNVPHDADPGDVYAFQDIDDPSACVSDRPAVAGWWRSRRAGSGAEEGTCCLCGKTAPLVQTHPELKNVPGGNPAGVALVSFNAGAFTSFGFSDDHNYRNAPFCRNCADAYTRALNRLLSPGFPHPLHAGELLPRCNYRLSNDTVALFWSSDPTVSSILGPAFSGDPGAVGAIRDPEAARRIYHAPHAGSPHGTGARFYSIILSGAQGRAILRTAFDLTMAEVVANLRRYFDDIDLVPMYPSELSVPPLLRIISSLQAPGRHSTVAGNLAQRVYESAVRGKRYPAELLALALRRLRAGGFARDQLDLPRFAIIKAALNDRFRAESTRSWKEVTVALDHDNTETGYRLGRLFAVLEKVQQEAQGYVNTTITDRMFGAAIATPAVVFSRLIKLSMHHIAKLPRRRGDSLRILIQEIYGGLPANAFPSTLPLNQQGLFAIGYYHQRADLWTSRKGAEPEPPTTERSGDDSAASE